MSSIEEQILNIEKEIRETPYHKATEHYIGKLRAKLSKLKSKQSVSTSKKKGGGVGYAVKKQGDATVILIGPPSVGKSTLLNRLTNAKSKVAPYAFTTLTVIPGMMDYKDAKIQILDVPGLIEGAEEGKGRGREVLSVTRGADLVIVITDVERIGAISRLKNILYKNGIRINQSPPDVVIDKKLTGGIIIKTNIKQDLEKETIKTVARELGIKNAEISIKENLDMERLIDAFSMNRVYVNCIFIVNKIDEKSLNINKLRKSHGKEKLLVISAEFDKNLGKLKETIWKELNFVRVYLVRPDEEPGENNPIVIKNKKTLRDLAEIIGTEFADDKETAKIWGQGSKFPGQQVSLSTMVVEGMQVRFM
jgi:small GTP-binding protein